MTFTNVNLLRKLYIHSAMNTIHKSIGIKQNESKRKRFNFGFLSFSVHKSLCVLKLYLSNCVYRLTNIYAPIFAEVCIGVLLLFEKSLKVHVFCIVFKYNVHYKVVRKK